MKKFLAAAAFAVLFASPARALDLVDLSQPESVVVDPKTGSYYISNVNGSPAEKDSNGFISKVGSDGLVVVIRFIESKPDGLELHAPKGLLIVDGLLYVTDIDSVKVFKLETGELDRVISFAPAEPQFLNDAAADGEGKLYVSDMLANRIYRVDTKDGDKVSVFQEGDELGQPNGLCYDSRNEALLAVTWGTGEILRISKTGERTVLRKDLEGLDGVTADRKGTLFVSSYTKGEIYSVPDWGKGPLALFQSGLVAPADLYLDPATQTLLVPLMTEGKVTSFPVKAPGGFSVSAIKSNFVVKNGNEKR